MVREKVGEMVVDIKGRTDDIQKKMVGVETKLGGLKQSFATFAKFVAGAYVAKRIIDAFKNMIKSTIKLGVSIDKTSKALQISTRDVQRLNYAMIQEHGSTKTLEKGLLNITTSLGYAGNELATYTQYFKDLGIEYRNADGTLRDAKDIFMDLADVAHKGALSQKEQAAAINLLSKRAYLNLIPALKKGSEWFGIMGDEAERMAGFLSDNMVDALKEADDEMTKLSAEMKGFSTYAAVTVLPIWRNYVAQTTELFIATRGLRGEKYKLARAIETVMRQLLPMSYLMPNVVRWFRQLKGGTEESLPPLVAMGPATEEVARQMNEMAEAMGGKNKTLAEQVKLEEKEIALLDTLSGATRRTGGEFRSLAEIWAVDTSEIGSAIGDISNKTKDWSEQTRALGGILASVFQKGKMDAKGFLNMMLSIGVSFIPGGGFLKGFLGALRFGEGGSFIPRAAQGLVTAPSMSPGGAIINDNPKTVPETVLTSQELQQLIYGVSHPYITIHNANPETYAEALINIPESIKYKLARFMSDEILNKTEALNE